VSAIYVPDPVEHATVHLEILLVDIDDSSITKTTEGTGLYLSRWNEPYLVTNWHNLTGFNPETGKLLVTGFVPRAMSITDFKGRKTEIDLYDADKNPKWIEIRERIPFEMKKTHQIDVAAIPPE